jgi:DNA-binding beta-propeller fold protein YncE
VVLKQGGKRVEIIGAQTKNSIVLNSGNYELELPGDMPGQRLSMEKVTLKRGDRTVVTVRDLAYDFVRRIEWPGTHVFHTDFSADSQLYLGGGDSGRLRIWDVSSGKLQHELPVPIGLFTPDGKYIIGHNFAKVITVFDLTEGKVLRTWEADAPVCSMAISPNGKLLISSHADNVLRMWNFATGKEAVRFGEHVEPSSVVFSPDGKRVLSAATDKAIRLWDVETGKEVTIFKGFRNAAPMEGHGLVIQGAFLPGGRNIVGYVWGKEKELLVWDMASGAVVRRLSLGADFHKDLAISPDGRCFVTAHGDRSIRLRDLTTGKEVQRLYVANTNVARAMRFSPDGRFLVSGSWRGWVYLWRLASR